MVHLRRVPLAGLIHLLFVNTRALNLGDTLGRSLFSLYSKKFAIHCTAKGKHGDEAQALQSSVVYKKLPYATPQNTLISLELLWNEEACFTVRIVYLLLKLFILHSLISLIITYFDCLLHSSYISGKLL